MVSEITNDIKISVQTAYQQKYSDPGELKYIFSYRITIENMGKDTVQLLRRHWFISDSGGLRQEVEGEGVIGEQPVLASGESHQYTSWTSLTTRMGKMHGTYLMQRKSDNELFKVIIPEFQLMMPVAMN